MNNMRNSCLVAIVTTLLLLVGCGSEQANNQVATISGGELALPVPERIRLVRALDPDDIMATASVDGVELQLQSNSDGSFSGSIQVPAESTFTVDIEFSEQFANEELVLATSSQSVTTGSGDQQLNLERSAYDFAIHDDDNDSFSNIAEREADTDPRDSMQFPQTQNNTLTAQFSVPAIIQNAQSVTAEYRIDGQLIGADRIGNSFSATSLINTGSIVVLDIVLSDTFDGRSYIIGTAQRTEVITDAMQVVSFSDSDFLLNQDSDGDGTVNFLEREAGTDPFNPPEVIVPTPQPVSCDVTPLPVTTGLPDTRVSIENISSFINCGGVSFSINASESASDFDFVWSQVGNNISWLIPPDSVAGSSFEFEIEVTNPSVNVVPATAVVSTRVDEAQCTETSRQVQFEASADLFLQNGQIFNNNTLRVNATNRTALMGFDVPAQEGQLTAAALLVTVGNDEGFGVIGVYQDDTFQFEETDTSLDFPALDNQVGFRDGDWESEIQYVIGLTELFVNGPRVNLFLQLDPGGNDVAFTSRETATPPVLLLEYTGCF